MINTNSYIWETSDINYVAYLTAVCGYKVNKTRKETDKKTGKNITVFVFFDNHKMIEADVQDFINGDIFKFIQARNGLLSLIRQNKSLTSEEFIERANNG